MGDERTGVRRSALCFINSLLLPAEAYSVGLPFPPLQELGDSVPMGPAQAPVKGQRGEPDVWIFNLCYICDLKTTAASCLDLYFDALLLRH